jgi:hypothetical protein
MISIGALHRIPGLSTTFHRKRAADKQAGSHGLEASSSFEIGALGLRRAQDCDDGRHRKGRDQNADQDLGPVNAHPRR